MLIKPIYIVAEPLRFAHRTFVRLAPRLLRASYLGLLSIVTLTTPSPAFAAAPRTFGELARLIVDILDSAAGVLVLAGIVIYFYGLSTNILKMKDEGGEKLRSYFVWGIIVIFVMVSIWGILRLLQNTLFGGDHFSPSTGSAARPASFDVPVYTQ